MAKLKIFRSASTDLEVGTSIYAAGDALGNKQGITVPPDGIVRAITMIDVADQTFTSQVWFFSSEPTGVTANAAFSLADADALLVTAVKLLPAAFDSINNQVRYTECNIPYHAPDSTLWIQAECETGTPTFSAGAVTLVLHIENE